MFTTFDVPHRQTNDACLPPLCGIQARHRVLLETNPCNVSAIMPETFWPLYRHRTSFVIWVRGVGHSPLLLRDIALTETASSLTGLLRGRTVATLLSQLEIFVRLRSYPLAAASYFRWSCSTVCTARPVEILFSQSFFYRWHHQVLLFLSRAERGPARHMSSAVSLQSNTIIGAC